MSGGVDVCQRPSREVTNGDDINAVETVADELYSLLDAAGSESIAKEFGIGTHSTKHDSDNHLKIGIFEGVNPSDSLAEKTATHDQELSSPDGDRFIAGGSDWGRRFN